MTRDEIIADLREKNPVMKSGNDTDGYVEFTAEEYEAQINEWADWVEADIKAKEDAEKAAVKAATDKAALLARLGMTADEAKLLLS
jgi:hypothetical protein